MEFVQIFKGACRPFCTSILRKLKTDEAFDIMRLKFSHNCVMELMSTSR